MAKRIRIEKLFSETEIANFRSIIMEIKKIPEPDLGVRNITLEKLHEKLLKEALADARADRDDENGLHNKLKTSPFSAITAFIDEVERGNRLHRRPCKVSSGSTPSFFIEHRHRYNLGDNDGGYEGR